MTRALLLLLVSAPAFAQVAPPVELDTVTVTVQGVTRAEHALPISDTLLTARQLDQWRVREISDAAVFVPNMNVSTAGGVNALTIRGIGGGGRNIGIDPRVGVYLDGVYIGQSQALDLPWLDIANVVVLSGPQGSAFGRNSISGALSLESEQPTEEFGGRALVEYGQRDSRTVEGVVSGPLGGNWKGRVAVRSDDYDGTVRNRWDNAQLNSGHSTNARMSAVWDGERTQWAVSYDFAHVHNNSIVGEATSDFFGAPLLNPLPPRNVAFNTQPQLDLRSEGGSVRGTWDTQYGTFTSITAQRHLRQARVNDTDYSSYDLLNLYYRDAFSTTSQEFRWQRNGARVDTQVGVYMARDDAHTDRLIAIGNDVNTLVPVAGVAQRLPFGLAYNLRPGFGAQSQANVRTDSAAVFGSSTWRIGQAWSVDLGGRLSWEHKRLFNDLNGSGSGRLGLATVSQRDNLYTHDFSPRLSALYAFNSTTNAYITYATGYKSGGWNVDFVNVQQARGDLGFDKETVNSWEMGVKHQSAQWNGSLAAFYGAYDDLQVSQFVRLPSGSVVANIRNAAHAVSKGVEARGQWTPTTAWDVTAHLGYLDATFSDFPNANGRGENFKGNSLAYAPAWSGAVTVAYKTAVKDTPVVWGVEHTQRSGFYSLPTNLPSEKVPSLALTNFSVSVFLPNSWRIGARVDNVFDSNKVVLANKDFFENTLVQYATPRTVRFLVEKSF